jgi:hypothetical protein
VGLRSLPRWRSAASLFVTTLAACGGGGGGSPSPAPTYSIGGSVSGLSASSLVLTNGTATIQLSSGASSFTIATGVASGTAYSVTVKSSPTGLTCAITNASGTVAEANVTDIAVSCAASEWMWVSGANTTGATGIYGTMGVSASTNVPGERRDQVAWIDGSNNLWLLGGAAGTPDERNDLWKFNPSTAEWTCGFLRHTRNRIGQQHAGSSVWVRVMDRRRREFVAVWWLRLRLNRSDRHGTTELPQGPVEICPKHL